MKILRLVEARDSNFLWRINKIRNNLISRGWQIKVNKDSNRQVSTRWWTACNSSKILNRRPSKILLLPKILTSDLKWRNCKTRALDLKIRMSAHNSMHLQWSFLTNTSSRNSKRHSLISLKDKLRQRTDLTTFHKLMQLSSLLQFQISTNHQALEVSREATSLARWQVHLNQF